LVNIDELYDYAYDKTIKGFQQTPTKYGKCEGKIFVGKNPEKIIREMEYREKKRILISKTQMGLNFDIYDLSSTVLSKDYEDPESLTDNEKSIKPFLEALIEDKISVRNYIDTISELQQPYIKEANKLLKEKKVKKFCPKCSRMNERELEYCTQCGTKLLL